ncbi:MULTISPECIES: aldose 1-epimerase [unclassified Schlesneria]|uniref:aldose 1-epimerase n=1 Tax=unclassified Schlesneria TaxID=2762017 RepID=UPI002F1E917E
MDIVFRSEFSLPAAQASKLPFGDDMKIVTICDQLSGSTARILPELGFNCFEFRASVEGTMVDVLDAVPGFEQGQQKPSGSGIPILFPFPNRIRAGRFNWKGKEYVLPGTDKWGNAIHGLCMDRPWRVVRQEANSVKGQFHLSVDAPDRLPLWPGDFIIEVVYELVRARLLSRFRIFNPTSDPLPWGLGTHPYFKLPLTSTSRYEDCLVEVPARERWELIDCLPTGKRLAVDESTDLRDGAYLSTLKLDDVYTGIDCHRPQFECLVMDESAGLQVALTVPPVFREIVAFTPPNRSAVCLEPYTCPTDAVNLQTTGLDVGWRVLGPGQEFHTWIDLSVGTVIV